MGTGLIALRIETFCHGIDLALGQFDATVKPVHET